MEARPGLSMQRSSAKQLSNHGISGPLSSSLPVHPTSLVEAYPRLTDSQQGSMENGLIKRPFVQASQLSSNSGLVGHLFSSSAGFSSELQYSSILPREKNPLPSPFLSQSNASPLILPQTSPPELSQPTSSSQYIQETNASWCPEELPGFLDFPAVQNNQVESNSYSGVNVIASEEFNKRNDWHEWADQLITDDDALTSNWNDLQVDIGVAELEPKMSYQVSGPSSNIPAQHQALQQLPASSGEIRPVLTPTSSANSGSSKPRMRWTPELHEAFVEAVNQLGGSERATPKGVLKLMKVEGLTIYHVKSHLQKYRTARYRPDSSEASSDKRMTPLEEISSLDLKTGIEITEALRLQMEVQKRLHEQLEIQRNLQLRIEEQGKYLQKMFEKQYKSGGDMLKASSSSMENPSSLSSDVLLEGSPAKNGNEDPDIAKSTLEERSQEDPNEKKQKATHEIEACKDLEVDDRESSPQSGKRARTD